MTKIFASVVISTLILVSATAPAAAEEMSPWDKKRFSAVPPVIRPRTRKGWTGARWRCWARSRLCGGRPLFGGHEGVGISMGRGDVGPVSSGASRSCTDNHNDRERVQA